MSIRFGTFFGVLIAGFAVSCASALGHVTAYPTSTDAGSSPLVRFTIPHGCDEKPTTKIEIQFPETVSAVRPVQSAMWSVSGGTTAAAAMAGHDSASTGGHATAEKHDEAEASDADDHLLTWTAKKPLAASELGTIEAWLVLPLEADTLWLPAVQTCEGGETIKWIAKDHDGEYPSPNIVVSEHQGSEAHDTSTEKNVAKPEAKKGEDSKLGLFGVILGGLGVLLGAAALLKRGK